MFIHIPYKQSTECLTEDIINDDSKQSFRNTQRSSGQRKKEQILGLYRKKLLFTVSLDDKYKSSLGYYSNFGNVNKNFKNTRKLQRWINMFLA